MREIEWGLEYNVYCDESCHLENDDLKAMSLGAVWCKKGKVQEANKRIREIKEKHRIGDGAEVKWTKASPCNERLYLDIVDYFFDDDDLHFRGLIVPDKSILDHEKFGQTHDEWYYKMYFEMLKMVFSPNASYFVYIDIKDTHSAENAATLGEVCANNAYDFNHNIVRRVQPIRSDEVQLMQLVDVLTGALAFRYNHYGTSENPNRTKVSVVDRISERSGYTLEKSTLAREDKFNFLVWQPYQR